MKEFFKKHVEYIQENKLCCQECGSKLDGIISEVAHILPKSRFKSIATEDLNILYLCSWTADNCHGDFDTSSNDKFKKMNVFPIVQERVPVLLKMSEERVTIKDIERYE